MRQQQSYLPSCLARSAYVHALGRCLAGSLIVWPYVSVDAPCPGDAHVVVAAW